MPPDVPVAGLKGDWSWLLAAAQAPARPIPQAGGMATGLVASGRYLFKGVTCNNTAGVAGVVIVRDGQDAGGVPVFHLAVAATSPAASPFLGDGVLCELGLYVVAAGLAGTLTIWAVPLKRYPYWPPGE